MRVLSERQREVLAAVRAEYQTPMQMGGTDGSDHSRVLASLVKLGLVERHKRHAIWCWHGTLHNGKVLSSCCCRGSCVYRLPVSTTAKGICT